MPVPAFEKYFAEEEEEENEKKRMKNKYLRLDSSLLKPRIPTTADHTHHQRKSIVATPTPSASLPHPFIPA